MRLLLVLAAGLWLAAGPAGAEEDERDKCNYQPKPPPPIQEVTISRQACQYLMQHELAADVTYKAGVDVRGQAVLPADLPGDDLNGLKVPETFAIELSPALSHWLPNDRPSFDTLGLSRINLGVITMSGGVLTFNGRPLNEDGAGELAALCMRQGEEER